MTVSSLSSNLAVGTATSTTGPITSQGIGSGLNVNSIVSSLMAINDIPLTQLQTAGNTIQATISTYGQVKSTFSTFDDAAFALTQPSLWQGTVGTSANPNALTVSTGSGAAIGTYAIQTQNLASAQSTVSTTFASPTSTVGSGTLQIQLGSWSTGNAAFTAQTGSTAVSITVSPTDSLATVAQNINAANAGVSASIVTDSTGSRLVLSSSKTGAINGFRVQATDADGNNTDANGLSALAFDPAGGTTSSTQTQGAVDANATINGLAITSASNTLSNVLQGLTVNLMQPTTAPVQVSVTTDTASIATAIQTFVTSYNAMDSMLTTDTAYTSATNTAGPLQGDSTAVTLQQQLRAIVGSASNASSQYQTLSAIGVQVQSDGTLSINNTTLANALNNPSQVQALFAATNATDPSNSGFAQQFVSLGNSVTSSTGLLTARVAGLQTSLTTNQTQQQNMNTQLAATQAMLQAQYSALDTQMASLTAQSNFVTQQIALWDKPSS
jgi:flagellar hook-associated protein 2